MERDKRNAALNSMLCVAKSTGFVTFDDIYDTADTYSLSIGDLDWLSNAIHSRNIIVYDQAPDKTINQDEFDDFAQSDYDDLFNKIKILCPSLASFIDNVKELTPPQRGEVSRLKDQVFEGNSFARDRLIEMYLRLAVRIAYQRALAYDYCIEDAIGDACIGLVIAVEKLNPNYSGSFASFASMWIYQTLSRNQSTKNPNIYFPVHRREVYYAVYPYLKRYGCIDCDYLPHCEKLSKIISDKTGCNIDSIQDIIIAIQESVSFEHYFAESPEDSRVICSEDSMFDFMDNAKNSSSVNDALNRLSEKQRIIIAERYGLDDGEEKTLDQLGLRFGVTRERIRQIESSAIRKLKMYLSKKRTDKFV